MLSEQDQEMIAVGASIAAGCRPCTTYHVRAARLAGASEEHLRQAVSDALGVRQCATEIMARLGAEQLGDAPTKQDAYAETRPLVRELVAVAAAYAVNCTVSLEAHMAAARAQGATNGQLLTALKIADAIRNTAGSKAQAVAAAAMGSTGDPNEPCGCQGGGASQMKQAAAAGECSGEQSEPCGCRS